MPKRRAPVVFVFHTTTWGYKLGHTSSTVHGLYPTWADAWHEAMTMLMEDEWEVRSNEEDMNPLPLPANKAALETVLKRRNGGTVRV